MATTDLARALATALEVDHLTVLSRRRFPYHSTFPLEELLVRTEDGPARSLVFKDLSRRGPDDPVWQIKAPFLHDPLREIEVYRDVLMPEVVSAPRCVAVAVEPAIGRYWLFLEKVDGVPLWQVGDLEVWMTAARWLANLHALFDERTRSLPLRLLVHDREFYGRWIERARRFARWPDATNGDPRGLDRLVQRCLQVVDWVVEQPVTFLHGEFYPSNVIIEGGDGATHVRPVDWEMASLGPGIVDLAALTSGAWSGEERERIAVAYREALPAELRPPVDVLVEGLDRCRLLLAVQWLGWSPDWSPPREHAHDWMTTAIDLAESLRA